MRRFGRELKPRRSHTISSVTIQAWTKNNTHLGFGGNLPSPSSPQGRRENGPTAWGKILATA